MKRFQYIAVVTRVAMLACLTGGVGLGQESDKATWDFAHDVVPVLRKHCAGCHGDGESKGGLSLNSRELLMDADVVVVGDAKESRLFELITSNDPQEQMPPRDRMRLSAKEIAAVQRWIDEGLPWDAGFTFADNRYEPPLLPRRPELPPVVEGRENPVDRILDRYLQQQELARPAAVEDGVFLRRLYMDLIGLLPDSDTVEAFVSDSAVDKRSQLIAALLSQGAPGEDATLDFRIAYAEHWLTFWNDLLRNDYGGTGFITGGRTQISGWLYNGLLTNKPYDQFVRELVAPTGESEGFIKGIRWRGDVNSSQTVEIQFAQNVTQSFLGINMKCASCHDSFIDRWTLEETYNLAAVFSNHPLQLHRCDKPLETMATPAWIFPELGEVDPAASQPERLKQLAALMTHPDNGRLTRTIVNRVWHRLMGRGIVHPIDAMHTEPWSSDLLDFLASDFADHGYDLKRTIGLICSSAAYQSRCAEWSEANEAGAYTYAGPVARRMTAEQFIDSVWQLTGTAPNKFDAPVKRTYPVAISADPGDPAGKPTTLEPTEIQAKWIWSVEDARGAAAGETRTFRKVLDFDVVPTRVVAAVTCDNEYILFINGNRVAEDKEWGTVESVELTRYWKPGKNTLLIVARNAGSSPGPAGLICEIRATDSAERMTAVGTDTTWQWTVDQPNPRGQFGKPPSWSAAFELNHADIWDAQVRPAIASALANAESGHPMMVRASLRKADALMRALGRPNRDQIVTSRPNGLTTLEAIDLANGEGLATALDAGGQRLLGRFSDRAELINQLFTSTLCRLPTKAEQAVADEVLGESATPQSVADLLWAILMLPEFQFVR